VKFCTVVRSPQNKNEFIKESKIRLLLSLVCFYFYYPIALAQTWHGSCGIPMQSRFSRG